MKWRLPIVILCIVLMVLPVWGEADVEVRMPPREDFHLFLLAGQSNMAGQGIVGAEDLKSHTRILAQAKDGTWRLAVDPIHYDKPVAGVGLGRSFAGVLTEANESISIGLVPAACGGSPIASWEPGAFHDQTKTHPYDDALKRVGRAMQDGVLKGILWHQGESDSTPARAAAYRTRLQALIQRFRVDLNAPRLPFIIGQLGQFPEKPWNPSRHTIDEAHQILAQEMDRVAFVSSDHLTCKSDNIHFDTRSLHAFGRRYAHVYQAVFPLSACGMGSTIHVVSSDSDSQNQHLKGER